MEKKFIDATARGILEVLKHAPAVVMSWGATDFAATVFNGMAGLKFSANGFIHRGMVVVAYNQGADLYEVYCLDKKNLPVDSERGVYFDQLVETIDRMVEKDCPDAAYDRKVKDWLKEPDNENEAAETAAFFIPQNQ